MKWLVGVVLWLLTRTRFVGQLPHRDASQGLLVVANHQSLLDGVFLWAYLPERPLFVIHEQVASQRLLRWVLRFCDFVTVDSQSPTSMKAVLRALKDGRVVVLFPEGRMTTTGGLMKVYAGADWLLSHASVPVLPVYIDGLAWSYFGALSTDQPRFLRPHVSIHWLPLIDVGHPLHQDAAGLLKQMVLDARPTLPLWYAVRESARRWGCHRQLVEDGDGNRWSYAQLLRRGLLLRPLWQSLAPGDKVGLLLPNRPLTLSVLLGIWATGRSAALLNITSGATGIAAACEVSGTKRVVTSRAFLDAISAQALPSAISHVDWVFVEDVVPTWQQQLLSFLTLILPAHLVPQVSVDEEAVVLFTSGSEGKPKGVSLSHDNILANVAQTCAVLDLSPADKFFIALPLFHSFGLTVGAILPLLRGIPLLLFTSPLQVKVIPELIYDRNCTVLFGSSTFLSQWGRSASRFDFHRLRYVIAGAEKLQPAVRDLWLDKFAILIFEGYGVTETAPVIAVNTRQFNQIGTVGQLVPGMQACIVPVEGLSEGGRLHVSGANVMRGYYLADAPNQLSAVPSLIGAPWYDTGDLARLEEGGVLRILGRQKRFAKIGGEMVSLELTEQLACLVDGDGHHAAVTVSDAHKGERIVLVTTNVALARSQLAAQAKTSGIPEIALPRGFVVVEKLPLLGSGKLDFAALASLAAQS
jgi:acyl-[acyl-carrier-protein]-phospholipid O-acyltransferase/long-chain-fatty-acid--[acyl-carrier-protein] ligase